jgi:hypothetical protein
LNFAPQLDVAWDRKGKGNSVLRAGIGLCCKNVIYNNFFDRPYREKRVRFSRPASLSLAKMMTELVRFSSSK